MTNSPQNKVLVLALSGIGNFIMQMPFFKVLKQAHPEWHITVAVTPRGTNELAQHCTSIDEVIELNLKQNFAEHIQSIKVVRQQHFSISFMLSPGQLIKGSLFLALSGIPERIAHRYPFVGLQHSSFLLTKSILENPDLHDIEQNLNLLSLIDINLPSESYYELPIPMVHEKVANDMLAQLNLTAEKNLIGFHVGSAPHFEWKRWPVENFIALGKELIAKKDAHLVLFGGPEEQALKENVRQALAPHATIINHSSLLTTAGIIRKCSLFISNDSGLMHLAAAVGIETFGLFGPTDENQTGPRGVKSHAIRAAGTNPVYNTEKNIDLGTASHSTLKQLKPADILSQLNV